MFCKAINKSKNTPCGIKGKVKYGGMCGRHRNLIACDEFDCSICMDTHKNGGKVIFKCNHSICTSCWIRMKFKSDTVGCPMCRGDTSGFHIKGKRDTQFDKKLKEICEDTEKSTRQLIEEFNCRLNLVNDFSTIGYNSERTMLLEDFQIERHDLISRVHHLTEVYKNTHLEYMESPIM